MKRWCLTTGTSYRELAALLGQATSTVCDKVNRRVEWQNRDYVLLRKELGLTYDFIQEVDADDVERVLASASHNEIERCLTNH
ncbi:XRE family transcriptional regulator [Bifidobacterium eulemuris]|uniref:XRE family transcriptional regulator n=3 Tax=Bifidobacterium TaxID=1678 RepID=A0A261FTK8_9BIFI|nr:XRE family transcriptional regulator [Bifidobacterium lemurum]OZG69035.1 XRE family transcriptional regulator [Bifidobacterium eulemuris]